MRPIVRLVRKWWPGLLPLAVLWLLAIWLDTRKVEADLASRATFALKGAILDRGRIEPAGRDLTLAAGAFSDEGRRSAVADVEATPGVRLVHDRTVLLPEAKPFVWSAERDVVRVTLGGATALPAIRGRLIEAARGAANGAEVVDAMGFARGAPPRFEAAALLLVDQLGRLKDGKIVLSDTGVSLQGMARDLGGREAIAAALRNLPEGYTVTDNAIQAPPYVFQVNKDPVAATVTLSGYVPDNAVHAALVDAIRRKFLNEKIVDNLKSSIGAPAGFPAAATAALGALSRLSTGSLTISDRDVRLAGDAFYQAAAGQVRDGLQADLPQGWRATPEIAVKPAATPVDAVVCQQLFSGLLALGRIRFESGKTAIDKDSFGLLDRLVEAALRCPTANFEIGGHTDADGDEGANQTLSERRAAAVADYMLRAGLPPERLNAVGYGETQPVAANDTDEGKAQNRRIEFTVR
jgi:OOP family OmpA-OmpF porin